MLFRSDYGTSKPIEGILKQGDVVLVVEDVVTSGGQLIEAVRSLRQAGAEVERVVAVIDRQEGAREAIEAEGLAFEALLTKSDLGIGS